MRLATAGLVLGLLAAVPRGLLVLAGGRAVVAEDPAEALLGLGHRRNVGLWAGRGKRVVTGRTGTDLGRRGRVGLLRRHGVGLGGGGRRVGRGTRLGPGIGARGLGCGRGGGRSLLPAGARKLRGSLGRVGGRVLDGRTEQVGERTLPHARSLTTSHSSGPPSPAAGSSWPRCPGDRT